MICHDDPQVSTELFMWIVANMPFVRDLLELKLICHLLHRREKDGKFSCFDEGRDDVQLVDAFQSIGP